MDVECYSGITRFEGGNDGSATPRSTLPPSVCVCNVRRRRSRGSSVTCSAYCIDAIIVARLASAHLSAGCDNRSDLIPRSFTFSPLETEITTLIFDAIYFTTSIYFTLHKSHVSVTLFFFFFLSCVYSVIEKLKL